MNSVVLGTGGYALLLSSFPILIALLRKQLKHRTATSFYMMAMFDLFYSILTAVLLLINHVRVIMNNDSVHNSINVSNASIGRLQMNSTAILTDHNATVPCDATDMVMEYAMLLIPLVNTFVSLLATSIQCNLRVLYLRNQCAVIIDAEDMAESDTSSGLNETGGKTLETNKILTFFKSNAPRLNGTKILSILMLIIQYFMPIIVTGSLYTVQNHYVNMTDYRKESDCIFCMNFPFKEYCEDTELRNATIESFGTTTSGFYTKSEDALKMPNSNNSQMDEILSKVQGIMLSAINGSDSKFTLGFYNKSDLLDVTKFMEDSSTVLPLKVDDNIDTYKAEILENTKSNYETISTPSIEDLDHESLDLVMPEEITEAYLKETSTMSHDDIYKDIIIRIHGTDLYTMKKKHEKPNNRHNKKSDVTQEKVLYNPDILKQILLYIENNLYDINTYANNHKCLLPPKYLKLYVLLVLLLIYFLPIVLASTMHMWGRLSCKFLQEKLDIKEKSMTRSLKNKPVAGFCFIDDTSSNDSVVVQSQEGHFSRAIRVPSITGSVDINKGRCLEIMKETNNMSKTLNIIKILLVSASVVWCPIIVQIVFKLFLCMHSPGWLMQATYLLAIGFCITRNIVNMSIVKLQEVCAQTRKRNSIRPSE